MKKYKNYLNLVIGVLIEALGFTMFLEPNNLAATDVSGLSIIFNRLFNINTSLFVLFGNILLILVSFIFLGKNRTYRTIIGSLLLPLFIFLTKDINKIFDFSTIDTIVLAILGGTLAGIGNGIVFKSGYTSGGTDIIEDIFCKYFHLTLDKSIMLVDGCVVLAGGIVFGIEPMVYSLLALLMMSIFSNRKLIGIDEDKLVLITTKKKKLVIDYLAKNYNYGMTIMDAVGEYSKTESDFIMCSVSTRNYLKIKKAIQQVEPESFMIVLNSYDTRYINKEERKNLKK